MQQIAKDAVAIFCPLCWLVVAFCIAMPIDTDIIENVADKEPMVLMFYGDGSTRAALLVYKPALQLSRFS